MGEVEQNEEADPDVVEVECEKWLGKTPAIRGWMPARSPGIVHRSGKVHGDGQNYTQWEGDHASHEIDERVGHVQNTRQFAPPNVARHIRRLVKRSTHIVDEQNDTTHAMLRHTEAETNKEDLNQMMNQNRQLLVLRHSRSPTKQQKESGTNILSKLKMIDSLQPDPRRPKGEGKGTKRHVRNGIQMQLTRLLLERKWWKSGQRGRRQENEGEGDPGKGKRGRK